MVLVDSNVLLDVITADPIWSGKIAFVSFTPAVAMPMQAQGVDGTPPGPA